MRMLQVSSYRLSRHAFGSRCVKLALICTPIIGTYYYGYTQATSPLFCPIRAITGIPCPSCGMTSAFEAIALGNFQEAIQYHLFAPLLFAGLLIAIAHLSLEIIIGRKIVFFSINLLKNIKFQVIFVISFLLYYGLRLYHLVQADELANDFFQSPLGSLFH